MIRFLTGISLGALITWLAWVPLCRAWVPRVNGAHWFLDRAYEKKDAALRASSSPKVVLVGASSVAFGMRAPVLEQELRRPVVNYAGTAALDVDFLLRRLVPELQAGDTVVLPLEHAFYGPGLRRSSLGLRAMAAIDQELGQSLVPRMNSRVAARTDPAWLVGSAPFDGAVLREIDEEISASGDYINNDQPAAPGTEYAQNKIKYLGTPLGAPNPEPLTSPLWDFIAEPVAALQAKGVLLLAAHANYFDDPAYQTPEWTEFFESVEEGWRRQGVAMVGQASDGFFPEELMWDSRSHVLESAAEDRARRLAAQLRPLLPVAPLSPLPPD